jgi:hypothetical protein
MQQVVTWFVLSFLASASIERCWSALTATDERVSRRAFDALTAHEAELHAAHDVPRGSNTANIRADVGQCVESCWNFLAAVRSIVHDAKNAEPSIAQPWIGDITLVAGGNHAAQPNPCHAALDPESAQFSFPLRRALDSYADQGPTLQTCSM